VTPRRVASRCSSPAAIERMARATPAGSSGAGPTLDVRSQGLGLHGLGSAQGGSGQTGLVALVADDNDLPVFRRKCGVAIGAGGVQSPLEHIALDDRGSGKQTVPPLLGLRPDVDHQCTAALSLAHLVWSEPYEPPPRLFKQLLDGGRRALPIAHVRAASITKQRRLVGGYSRPISTRATRPQDAAQRGYARAAAEPLRWRMRRTGRGSRQ
jgi:hypothetical protein